MKVLSKFTLTVILASSCPFASTASDIGQDFSLEEISVTSIRGQQRALQPSLLLSKKQFDQTLPTAFTEIFRAVLGTGIRTNSRGEAVLRLRGSEERQSQIFIDGAPISVPWDGRTDLSLFPASLVREVRVIKSAAPLEYGANAVLGVVDISTLETGTEFDFGARSEIGTHNSFLIEGETYIPLDEGLSLQVGANHRRRDAISVADNAPIPFDPLDGDGRTNTDLESTSLFAAAAIERDWGQVRLSVLDISAEKGIAAEAHLNPSQTNVRFWRYPDWDLTQLSLASEIELGDTTSLRLNSWHQRFSQSILSFNDISYSTVEERQDDRDRTYGGRAVLSHDQDLFSVRLLTSYQESTHKQREFSFIADPTGGLERFRQRLYSVGGEVDIPFGEQIKTSFSLAYDRSSTPLSGGRPQQPAFSKFAGSAAIEWQATSNVTITGTLGQRTRFPTARELYGTALGRFLLNDSLRPETVLVGDLTVAWVAPNAPLTLTVTPWFSRIDDTLSQRNINVDGNVFSQRFNLEGSSGYGLEATAIWQATKNISLEVNGFWQKLKADRDENGIRPTLYQRPDSQILIASNYQFANGANFRAELNHTGPAFDENQDGTVANLPSSTEINLRAYVPVRQTTEGEWQLYGTIDNLTNTVVLPQLGLPAAGRTFKIGIRIEG